MLKEHFLPCDLEMKRRKLRDALAVDGEARQRFSIFNFMIGSARTSQLYDWVSMQPRHAAPMR